jgi:glycosyltransferase involved in cell wall biosynthesis
MCHQATSEAIRSESQAREKQRNSMSIAPSPGLGWIVLVDPSDFTPPYDLALARAMEAEGRDVQLVGQAGEFFVPHPRRYSHFYPVLASTWGRRLPSGAVRIVKGISHGFDMLRLSRWLATFDPCVVHFQWSPIPVIDGLIIRSFRRRCPVVLTLHDSNPCQGDHNAANWLMRQGYGGLLQSFDAIVVHTQQAERRVAATGIDPAVIHRIPHGLLDAVGHSVRPTRSPTRDRLVLLQFGKIKPYKGVDLLLEALTLVPREMRNRLDVRIVGKPYMDTGGIEQFVNENELASCVTFRFEFVSAIEQEQLFTEADAIVLPYREIDASGVAMSAIARSMPVLATDLDGFRETFGRAGGARLVPPADAAALAKAIADWISAPEQLDALSDAMHLRRASIPTWEEIARLHFAVYAEAYARWNADRGLDGSTSTGMGQTS